MSLCKLILAQGKQSAGLKRFATAFYLGVSAQSLCFLQFLIGRREVKPSPKSNGLKREHRDLQIPWG